METRVGMMSLFRVMIRAGKALVVVERPPLE